MNPSDEPPVPSFSHVFGGQPNQDETITSPRYVEGKSVDDQSPSFGAAMPVNNSQLSGTRDYDYASNYDQLPSIDGVRQFDNSQVSGGQDYYAYAQPPSTGAVRPVNDSQYSGIGNNYASGQLPSVEAVRPLDDSRTEVSDSQAVDGVGLPAPKFNFRMIQPNAFKRDNYDD
ncbi:hypothetical protein R6Q59_033519 [Mikania micrantha]|uniref:Uncharacterized protein n=1 Tax=Mikania micrantha TaxID=192012 RepID=A0A5N6NU95_9ASTR|nr:hypothetical protein E3N88_18227 [Mikania micrantha]